MSRVSNGNNWFTASASTSAASVTPSPPPSHCHRRCLLEGRWMACMEREAAAAAGVPCVVVVSLAAVNDLCCAVLRLSRTRNNFGPGWKWKTHGRHADGHFPLRLSLSFWCSGWRNRQKCGYIRTKSDLLSPRLRPDTLATPLSRLSEDEH